MSHGCTALSHMSIMSHIWCRSTALSHNDIGLIYWASIEPLSHIEPYWCLSHSIELFWCLMLLLLHCDAVALCRAVYIWTGRTIWRRWWTAKVEHLVISRERRRLGANRLPCIGLYPTRSAYFGSDGCKKAKSEFPPFHLVQTYITLHFIGFFELSFFFATL